MGIVASSTAKSTAQEWKGEITSGKHHMLTDEPESLGGQDAGPAPYGFITAGLASCTMITLRMYAKHKGFDIGEFSVSAEFHANKEGTEWIERRLHFSAPPSEEIQQKLLEISGKTPVTKTLLRSLEIHTQIA